MTDVTFLVSGSFLLHRTRVDVADICADCINRDALHADMLIGDDVPQIELDKARITQVITNLRSEVQSIW
jgi:hypothetical protein